MGTAGSGVPGRPPRAWQRDSGNGSQPALGYGATSAHRDPVSQECTIPCSHRPLLPGRRTRGGVLLPPGHVLALPSPARSKRLRQRCRQIPAGFMDLCYRGWGCRGGKWAFFALFHYTEGQDTGVEHLPAAPVLPGGRSRVTARSQRGIRRQTQKRGFVMNCKWSPAGLSPSLYCKQHWPRVTPHVQRETGTQGMPHVCSGGHEQPHRGPQSHPVNPLCW